MRSRDVDEVERQHWATGHGELKQTRVVVMVTGVARDLFRLRRQIILPSGRWIDRPTVHNPRPQIPLMLTLVRLPNAASAGSAFRSGRIIVSLVSSLRTYGPRMQKSRSRPSTCLGSRNGLRPFPTCTAADDEEVQRRTEAANILSGNRDWRRLDERRRPNVG